jgi:hypothetical protein
MGLLSNSSICDSPVDMFSSSSSISYSSSWAFLFPCAFPVDFAAFPTSLLAFVDFRARVKMSLVIDSISTSSCVGDGPFSMTPILDGLLSDVSEYLGRGVGRGRSVNGLSGMSNLTVFLVFLAGSSFVLRLFLAFAIMVMVRCNERKKKQKRNRYFLFLSQEHPSFPDVLHIYLQGAV